MSSSFETNRLLRRLESTFTSKLCDLESILSTGGTARTARTFEYEVISGVDTFTFPAGTISASIHVITEGTSGSISVTTPSAASQLLYPNQTVSWSLDDLPDNVGATTPPSVATTNAGDVVAISYVYIN